MKKALVLFVGLTATVLSFAAVLDNRFNAAFGPLFHRGPNVPLPVAPTQGLDSLHRWNLIAINASGLDHTPVAPGENRVFGEQFGPGRASRAMAIVHIAMFDALDAVAGGYTSYTGTQASPGPMSVDAAIAQAARDTLAAMFPSQTPTFNAYLAEDLARVTNGHKRANVHRDFLGLRCHAKLVRASETLQSARGPNCRPEKFHRHSICAFAGPGKRRDGGRCDDDLGIQISLRLLAPDCRHSGIGSGHGAHASGGGQS